MENRHVPLFVGDQDIAPSEQALVSRLRRDLESRGVRASLYANFYPASRETCQIDLLVRTERRTAHIEIKDLRRDYPVRGDLNGPWVQILPGGTERLLEKNGGRQALNGTYAISDAMRDLARKGIVEGREVDFKRHIDTIVGMWEIIPDGSDIKPPPHVTVCGYTQLLDRLTTPGPVVPWTDDEWDAFARRHSLFQLDPESEPERRRRSSLESITDYRLEAQHSLSEGLGTFVDVGATDDHETEMSATDISDCLTGRRVLAAVGPPGCGKSLLAQRVAVNRCDDGDLVVLLRAGDYEAGRFSDLVARSMSRCSTEDWNALVSAAKQFGVPITVVLDGMNECPYDERGELLEELRAFTTRYPASILIMSTTAASLPERLRGETLRIREPDARAREEILVAHGARHPRRFSDQFRTPYELAIAAQCESELNERSSVTELHAAYIRRFASTEQIRTGLRALATRLHAKLRTSLSMPETTSILNDPSRGLTPSLVDKVLNCHLLVIEHHRARFRHELVGQFFASEDIVRSATSGQSLGQLLTAPANATLTEIALGIEGDHRRVWYALRELANPELIFSGLVGRYGADVAEMAAQEIRDVLHRAVAATEAETPTLESEDGFFGRWITERCWTEWERALLAAAGRGLTRGLFVDEVCELIDRTDKVCLARARKLKAEGEVAPVSRVVAATYTQTAAPTDGYGLAASYVVRAFELATMMTRCTPDRWPAGLANRFSVGPTARSWGRFYLALLCVDPDDASDQALFASLLQIAWNAGGYDLQLRALSVAECFGGSDEPRRSEILKTVRELDSDDVILQSTLVEVLARFGEIENPTAVEELQDAIREVIAHPDDVANCHIASGMISLQFEDPAIFGPYYDAIDGLTRPEKAWLFTMAAQGSDLSISMWLCWTLDQLRDLVPTGDAGLDTAAKSAFATLLDGPPEDATMPTDAASACLAAIRGWAKFEPDLPPESAELTPQQRNWRLVAKLLLRYERSDVVVDVEETWRALHSQREETLVTLASLEDTTWSSADPQPDPLRRLIEDYPDRLRCLFEWALVNPEEVPIERLRRRTFAPNFVIRMLGAVGDESTAARLEVYLLDPEAGRDATDAIRQINRRIAP